MKNSWERKVMKLFVADSTALEWAMSALAFVWGIAALVTQMHHQQTFYMDHVLQGGVWYALNATMVIATVCRVVAAAHNGDLLPVRRTMTGLLGAIWGTLGVYVLMHWSQPMFAIIYLNAAVFELWAFLRLSIEGVGECNGYKRR